SAVTAGSSPNSRVRSNGYGLFCRRPPTFFRNPPTLAAFPSFLLSSSLAGGREGGALAARCELPPSLAPEPSRVAGAGAGGGGGGCDPVDASEPDPEGAPPGVLPVARPSPGPPPRLGPWLPPASGGGAR